LIDSIDNLGDELEEVKANMVEMKKTCRCSDFGPQLRKLIKEKKYTDA